MAPNLWPRCAPRLWDPRLLQAIEYLHDSEIFRLAHCLRMICRMRFITRPSIPIDAFRNMHTCNSKNSTIALESSPKSTPYLMTESHRVQILIGIQKYSTMILHHSIDPYIDTIESSLLPDIKVTIHISSCL